jgi:hypothetical protein
MDGSGHERSRPNHRPDRDREVVERSLAGTPLVEIGQVYGYVSPGPAIRLVERSLDLVLPQLDPDLQRRLDLARLDRLLSTWWSRANDGDPVAARLVLDVLDIKSRVRRDGTERGETEPLDRAVRG